jgi:hypothetical protein
MMYEDVCILFGCFGGRIRHLVNVHSWLMLRHSTQLEDEFGDLGCVSNVVMCKLKQWLSLWS